MPEEIIMPKFGWTMSEGTVTGWLKNVGDVVDEGDPLFSIETEKVNYEVEAREGGVLLQIVAQAGDVVAVGGVVGYLGTPAEAAERGIAVVGSSSAREQVEPGPVEDATVVAPLAAEGSRVIPLSATRRTIAERMRGSLRESAQLTLTTSVDASGLVAARDRLTAQGDVGYHDLLLVVVAHALKNHAQLNSTLEDGAIHLHEHVHVGLAVDTPNGLLVPVVRDVDRKDALTIGRESRALAARARDGLLTAQDVEGGTFTLTNLGAYGIDVFTPIVNPPQTAILGVGRIVETPVVRAGRVEAGRTMSLSLSFDHQVVDGAPAARFLQEIARAIEAGAFT